MSVDPGCWMLDLCASTTSAGNAGDYENNKQLFSFFTVFTLS